MLDEEFEQVGIDSIMGGTAVMNNEESVINHNLLNYHHPHQHQQTSFVYGYPPGFHHPYWSGGDVRNNNNNNNNNRAFRRSVDDWWNYPVVDVLQISPRLHSISNNQMTVTTNVDGCGEFEEKTKQSTTTTSGEKTDKNGNSKQKKKKLKKKKIAKLGGEEVKEAEETKEDSNFGRNLLKLNYDEVLKEWSGKGSPFPEEIAGGAFLEDGCDASAIAAQIDLFSSDGNSGGGGGVREASVLRYKEKRLSRLFSKKIRYQVRKVNADQRPRMKGRFVRRLSCNKNNRNRSHVNHKDNEL